MKLVLLTREQPEHRYVANVLDSAHPLAAILVDRGRPMTRRQRFAQLRRRYGTRGMPRRAAYRAWAVAARAPARRKDALAKVLGPRSDQFERPSIVRPVFGLNTDESVALLSRLQPDMVLVYGTSIIADRVLDTAAYGALNMHTGLSPHYRGSDCAFWPLYNNELHMLGATVHECTSAVDGGRIFGKRLAQLGPSDGVEEVFARCVLAGADLYADVVAEMAGRPGSLRGETQDLSVGREYRARMRGVSAEVRTRARVRRGLIRAYAEGGRAY